MAHGSLSLLTEKIFQPSGSGNGTFNIANRLYIQKKFDILPQFKQITAACYHADATNIDFQGKADQSRLEINKWVKVVVFILLKRTYLL